MVSIPIQELDPANQAINRLDIQSAGGILTMYIDDIRFSGISGSTTAAAARLQTDKQIPSEFALSQNYPNPFNPTTVIRAAIPQRTEVILAVYDVLGREVQNIYRGEKDAGYYVLSWNGKDNFGRDVPSGVYFARLVLSNGTNLSRKMMLLR